MHDECCLLLLCFGLLVVLFGVANIKPKGRVEICLALGRDIVRFEFEMKLLELRFAIQHFWPGLVFWLKAHCSYRADSYARKHVHGLFDCCD